jgi:hypothetical protein
MSTVAERADGRCTAAAEGKRFFAFQVKRIPLGIRDCDGAGDKEWAIVSNNNFDFRHLRAFNS